MKNSIFLLFLVLVFIPTSAYAQDELTINGETWNQFSRENKIFYLAGYLKGAYRGTLIGLRDVDCVSYTEVASKAQEKYRNFVGKGNMKILFDEIEQVYKTKKNLTIEIDEVIVFALKKNKEGMSAQKQEAWLDLLRTMNR